MENLLNEKNLLLKMHFIKKEEERQTQLCKNHLIKQPAAALA